MNTFLKNLITIKNSLSETDFTMLLVLASVHDPKDVLKKVNIEIMLDNNYNQELDWLYSTLSGQQSVRVFSFSTVYSN